MLGNVPIALTILLCLHFDFPAVQEFALMRENTEEMQRLLAERLAKANASVAATGADQPALAASEDTNRDEPMDASCQ